MPFYERGPVRIHYEEVGSGFPLLLIPGGGLNSSFQSWETASPFKPMDRRSRQSSRLAWSAHCIRCSRHFGKSTVCNAASARPE